MQLLLQLNELTGKHERRPITSDVPHYVPVSTGELPLRIIRMKVKGCEMILSGNTGFTLPNDLGELGDDVTELDLSGCSLIGA
jgi:hypothetical protein